MFRFKNKSQILFYEKNTLIYHNFFATTNGHEHKIKKHRGKKTMAVLLLSALAISGGFFLGTILFSTYKVSTEQNLIALTAK